MKFIELSREFLVKFDEEIERDMGWNKVKRSILNALKNNPTNISLQEAQIQVDSFKQIKHASRNKRTN